MRASVDAGGLGRYESELEATLYFCCVEALQNVAKHAGEHALATVQVREERGVLVLTVRDDGRGFDTATGSAGSGLVGISDRLAAIGGTLRVDAAPAAGTTLTAVVPTGSRPARPVEQEPAGGERFGSRRDERPVG